MEPSFFLRLPILVQYMYPAATSTTSPSGNLRPSLMTVCKSEPSGFADNTRPAPRSRKNSRPDVVDLPAPVFAFFVTVRLLLNFWLRRRSPLDRFTRLRLAVDSLAHCGA